LLVTSRDGPDGTGVGPNVGPTFSAIKTLLNLNDAPYGDERPYNGLRLATALTKLEESVVRVFLMADAVNCAKPGQVTPGGYYNIGRMVKGLVGRGVAVGCCGTCMDARGVGEADLAEGTRRSSMAELADWTAWADKVITF
jgi:uncharacterized protein involved in oxidation of intracellular sulfur